MNSTHQAFKDTTQGSNPPLTPAVDIYETETELILLADLPGVTETNLQLGIDHGILTLEGAINENGIDHQHRYYRQFRLTDKIDTNGGNATLKNGVLTLRLPKSEVAKPKKIAVKTLH